MDIQRIYHVYTSKDIPCIYMDIPRIYLVDIPGISMEIPCISTMLDIHGSTTYIPCILVRTAYTWNIRGIYQAYTENWGSRFTCGMLGPTRSQILPTSPVTSVVRPIYVYYVACAPRRRLQCCGGGGGDNPHDMLRMTCTACILGC